MKTLINRAIIAENSSKNLINILNKENIKYNSSIIGLLEEQKEIIKEIIKEFITNK